MSAQKSHHCLDFAALEALIDAPAAAEARLALGDCPRCRARLSLLAEFLADASRPLGAQPEIAAQAIRRVLAGELASPAEAPSRRRLRPLSRRDWSLAAGLAAVLCLLAIGLEWRWLTPESPDRWRGERSGAEIVLLPPQSEAGGRLLLSWRALPGAATYRIEVLDSELDVLQSLTATDTLLLLDPLNSPAARPAPLAWQVTALPEAGSPALAQSPVARLPLP